MDITEEAIADTMDVMRACKVEFPPDLLPWHVQEIMRVHWQRHEELAETAVRFPSSLPELFPDCSATPWRPAGLEAQRVDANNRLFAWSYSLDAQRDGPARPYADDPDQTRYTTLITGAAKDEGDELPSGCLAETIDEAVTVAVDRMQAWIASQHPGRDVEVIWRIRPTIQRRPVPGSPIWRYAPSLEFASWLYAVRCRLAVVPA